LFAIGSILSRRTAAHVPSKGKTRNPGIKNLADQIAWWHFGSQGYRFGGPEWPVGAIGIPWQDDFGSINDAQSVTASGRHVSQECSMASIIGGIGTSHVPTIGVAYDKGKQQDPLWKPLFDGYTPVAAWLAEQQADVLVFFYNDHCTTFFFDLYPTFALGIGERFPVADEGAGLRNLPPIRGDVQLQAHIAECLVNDEFDLTVFQDKPIDHGCAAPLPLLWPHVPDWPGTVVPIAINVLQYPLPTARRCYRLGQAVRRAIESYPEDLKVVVVGTGGLSHQIHGERTGFNNTEWDMEFLDRFQHAPETLTDLTHTDYVRLGGAESVEQIMWLAMRGALGGPIRKLHQNYYLMTTTAMTVVLYEPGVEAADAPSSAQLLAHAAHTANAA
jgi:protocatechuate 4,5-dioxygenase beta chain